MIIKKGNKDISLASLINDAHCTNFHIELRSSLVSALANGSANIYSVKKISTITIVKLKWLDMDFSITCGSRTSIRVLSTAPSNEYLFELLKCDHTT